MTGAACVLYSSRVIEVPPVEVAIALRRRIARDALLDPFGWVGLAVVALVLHGMAASAAGGSAGTAAVVFATLGVLATITHRTADFLLFGMAENDFLRTQPIGPRGLLTVRLHELSWWTLPTRLLAAACGLGAAGPMGAAAVFVAGTALNRPAMAIAMVLRDRVGSRATAVGALGSLVGAAALVVPTPPLDSTVAAIAVSGAVGLVGGLSGRAMEGVFDRRYARAASAAARAGDLSMGRLWSFLDRVLPLPAPIRARLVRDLVLLPRGWDGRALFLLAMAPLAGVFLAGELQGHLRPAAFLWRVLQATALGGAAVAYAVGPGVHALRNSAMVWERTAPRPGRRASAAAHLYGAGFAAAHGLIILASAAFADGGRHLPLLAGVAPAVFALELALAHYTVAYGLSNTTGRRIAGEATLAFAIPVVGVAVAGVSLIHPALGLVYFAVTASMYARGVARYEAVEVTW